MSARSRLRAARRVESPPSLMKKDPDQNSADSAEIKALITRLERGQLRDGDAQLLARLLRLLLRLITLLQQKNACKPSATVHDFSRKSCIVAEGLRTIACNICVSRM